MSYSTLRSVSKEQMLTDRLEAYLAGRGFHQRLNNLYPDGDIYIARAPFIIPSHLAGPLAQAAHAAEVELHPNHKVGTTRLVLKGVAQ